MKTPSYEKMAEESFIARMRGINNDNDSRARFWAELMREGHILTFFHSPTGKAFTAGQYQTATVGHAKFSLLWPGIPPHNLREWTAGQAWDIAIRIVQYVGRQRPINITEKES